MKKIGIFSRTTILIACMLVLGSNVARTDDTDIFTGGEINVPPNVLIILDTSGSMADTIRTQTTYDPSHTYSGSYVSNGIYYRDSGWHKWQVCREWAERRVCFFIFCWDEGYCADYHHILLSEIICPSAQSSLSTVGYWTGHIDEDTLDCPTSDPGTYRQLATGNYLNWSTSSQYIDESKEDIAKRAIKTLLDSISEGSVRFGLMRFRGNGLATSLSSDKQNRGGYIVAPIGKSHAEIKTAVDNQEMWYGSGSNPYSSRGPTTSGGTPLAETLAEAGLYFAGKQSWANTEGQEGYPTTENGLGSDGVYTSPIQWRCQKNYIIVVTDGMPMVDDGSGNDPNIFTRANYINNQSIDDYYQTSDGMISEGGSSYKSYMPATAKFLANVDLIDTTEPDSVYGDSWNDPSFPPQTVHTFAIGFGGECDATYLQRVTNNDHGKGGYYLANDAASLQSALSGIVGSILSSNGNFVAPVVPVNKMNGVYSGNSVYLGLFRPTEGGEWKGNLKKFGFSNDGELLDKSGNVADFDSGSYPSSCWDYSLNDGVDVDEGGAGEQLLHQSIRNFYSYQGLNSDLTASSNQFNVTNTALTANTMGLAADTSAADIADLIHYIRADGDYTPLTGDKKREWVLGDILHSRPAVLRDGNKNVIFVGANDGFLHCFADDEGTTYDDLSDDSVTEEWCFVPWDQISRLHLLRSTRGHEHFVDGTPVLHRAGNNLYLTFGLRRGGNRYYTLNVGSYDGNNVYIPNGYKTPKWEWEIAPYILAPDCILGQSWCTPRARKIKTATGAVSVLILTGGYDAENQDLNSPAETDTYGRAIYAVNANDGTLSSLLKFTPSNLTSLTHSIVDLVSYDSNDDGCDDKIYAGDMGGNVFAFKADLDTGIWSGRKFFQAPDGLYKFFYAPDVVREGYQYMVAGENLYSIYDLVYIGTGDRAHPNETSTVNRFYCIKNRDDSTVLTESSSGFMDVTTYASAYNNPNKLNFLKSSSCDGWYFRLGYELGSQVRSGEKVVSSPLVFGGMVFFTTFVPVVTSSDEDLCGMSGVGEGRLYAVDYLTGEAIEELNFYKGNDVMEDGEVTVVIDERDRSMSLGSGIPTAPTLAVTSSGPVLLVGTSDGVQIIPIPLGFHATKYFWLQEIED